MNKDSLTLSIRWEDSRNTQIISTLMSYRGAGLIISQAADDYGFDNFTIEGQSRVLELLKLELDTNYNILGVAKCL